MKVELLTEYEVKEKTSFLFANGTRLEVEPGIYYTVAFGLVLEVNNHVFIPANDWRVRT